MKNIKVIMLICGCLVFLLFIFINPPWNTELYGRKFYKNGFEGIVYELYIDQTNHNARVVKLTSLGLEDENVFEILTPKGNHDIFTIVSYGDTILKAKNSSKLQIKGRKINRTLEYRIRSKNNR
ncbi:MAG: hypothetical protein N4A71_01110 [Carboxylicivirga sp.]|jgi:hypothetical protein|nr:hypothetical protein [Carboxylicivirga sp.]